MAGTLLSTFHALVHLILTSSEVDIIIPFNRWRNEGSDRLSDLTKIKGLAWSIWDLKSGLRSRSRLLTCTKPYCLPPHTQATSMLSPGYHSSHLKNAHKWYPPNEPVRRQKEILAWLWVLRPLVTLLWAHNSFSCAELSTRVSPQLAYPQLYLPGRLEAVLSPASALYSFSFFAVGSRTRGPGQWYSFPVLFAEYQSIFTWIPEGKFPESSALFTTESWRVPSM